MPHWIEYQEASKKLRAEWDKIYDNLWVHERGHGEIARRGANLLYVELTRIPPAADCQQLSDALNQLAKHFDKTIIEPAQRKYDQRQQNEAPSD